MNLEWILEWADSGGTNCPAFYKADTGNYVIQGWKLDDDTRAQLRKLAGNEDAVEIPASLIDAIAAQVRA